jgi:O-acetyl-ADP-ribose deacetylase (regulator of RNase III)
MIDPKKIELILVDVVEELCEFWRKEFSEYSEVTIHNGYFQEVKEYDCIVSPANSFGLMDGGIDLAIRNYFGMKLQYRVNKVIQKDYYGEQLVGTSIIVETENEHHPFLAHTPTMRVPKDISKTDNVYNAMFAMLRAVANHNKNTHYRINKVLCPGLGTLTGQVPYSEAARQMAVAYHNFKNPTSNLVWSNLIERDQKIIKTSTNTV